jgi:hypothetical protein
MKGMPGLQTKNRKTAPNRASERQKNHREKKVFSSSYRQCFDFASSRTSKLNISAEILTFSPLF